MKTNDLCNINQHIIDDEYDVRCSKDETVNSFGKTLRGIVRDKNKKFEVELIIDKDEALKQAVCQCNYYQQNKLYKGPCEHMLAVRKKVNEKVNEKFKF